MLKSGLFGSPQAAEWGYEAKMSASCLYHDIEAEWYKKVCFKKI